MGRKSAMTTAKHDHGFNQRRALYIRVSTEAQAEEGYSIQAQTERLEAYCKAMGWDNYEAYIDGGFSGSNLNRPEMRRLISDVDAGNISAVIVYKLDRLSRSQKDTLFLIEDVFMPNSVDFISINESIDTSTPYGRAMIGILSAFAQLERENIYMRTRMGMLERVKQGYWMGGGGVPFGYDYDRDKGILIPNEDAEVVRKMYDLYIKGWSAQKIADLFGLKYDKLVTQILVRRSNLGVISYKGEEYEGLHDAIISKDVYDLAMQKMTERSEIARVSPASRHLLTGLVYCGDCGSRMRYIRWGKAGYKLRCYSQDTSKPYMKKSDDCASAAVWADQVESIVLGDLFKISANLEELTKKDASMFVDPLTQLAARITQTENKLKRLYNLYAIDQNDTLLETIEDNKRALAKQRAAYAEEEASSAATRHLESIKCQVSSIAETWPLLSDAEKQSVIRECVQKIVITGSRIEIFYTFKQCGENAQVA